MNSLAKCNNYNISGCAQDGMLKEASRVLRRLIRQYPNKKITPQLLKMIIDSHKSASSSKLGVGRGITNAKRRKMWLRGISPYNQDGGTLVDHAAATNHWSGLAGNKQAQTDNKTNYARKNAGTRR